MQWTTAGRVPGGLLEPGLAEELLVVCILEEAVLEFARGVYCELARRKLLQEPRTHALVRPAICVLRRFASGLR